MMTAAVSKELAGVADAGGRLDVVVAGRSFDERHHCDAGLEAAQAQRQLRKEQETNGDDRGDRVPADRQMLNMPIAAGDGVVPSLQLGGVHE
jgi:hypothetical protein